MRTFVQALLLTSLFSLIPSAPASAYDRTTLTRTEIRAMPIQERPSRPGHFYGNTVRRMNRPR